MSQQEDLKKTVKKLQQALRNAAEDAFKSEELDTEMWELRDEGLTKEQWIEDKIDDWKT